MNKHQAKQYRAIIEIAAESLSDEQALKVPMLFKHWQEEQTYEVGERIYYNEVLYTVLQAHTSQASWTPDAAPSLFAQVLIPDTNTIYDWIMPSSTNPYMKGDKVKHNGFNWESEVDNNVWEPGVYGWRQI